MNAACAREGDMTPTMMEKAVEGLAGCLYDYELAKRTHWEATAARGRVGPGSPLGEHLDRCRTELALAFKAAVATAQGKDS